MKPELWNGRRVLLTGHTGFKGSWLCKWLDQMGAKVLGISLKPDGFTPYEQLSFSENVQSVILDLAQAPDLNGLITQFQPEVVLHLAAQALVGDAYEHPADTFQSNVMGTVRLLDSLRDCSSIKAIVVITSDKVYENLELGIPFVEGDPLGGDEPYSASKVCQEQVTKAYFNSYFKKMGIPAATARGSNVYGGGDYHYDRLIPALIRGILEEVPLTLRNPYAIRPWQYVLCLLEGYLLLAEHLMLHPDTEFQGWNFGPVLEECVPVGQISALLTGNQGYEQKDGAYAEANTLSLNASKSMEQLGWYVRVPLEKGLARTKELYRRQYGGETINHLMEEELERYANLCIDCL